MVIVMNILCSVVDIIMPLFQRQAIDSFIEKNTLAGLGGFIALYIAVIVFQMWSVICFTRGCMTLDVETGRDMKRALFVHLQKLSFSYYNATPVGYILSRVMNDVARITELIAWDVIDMLWAIFYVVGVFVAMLFLNWKLALVIMLIVPAEKNQFQDHKWLQRRNYGRENCEIPGCGGEKLPGVCLCH